MNTAPVVERGGRRVGSYPPAVVGKAYELYMTTTTTVVDIAKSLNIPECVVRGWVSVKGWAKQRAEMKADVQRDINAEYKELVARKRLEVTKRHLNTAQAIEQQIHDLASTMKLSPTELMKIAAGFKSSADVSARAVGIGEEGGRGGNKLIVVGLAPSPMRTAIDVTDASVEPELVGAGHHGSPSSRQLNAARPVRPDPF